MGGKHSTAAEIVLQRNPASAAGRFGLYNESVAERCVVTGLVEMSMNAAAVVFQQAALRPGSAAVITDRQIVTYAELRRLVSVLAHHLKTRGIEAGQIVGVTMVHRPLHLFVLLALAQLGAVSLPLHPSVPHERRLLAARRFGADAIVSGRSEFALDGLRFVGLSEVSFAPDAPGEPAVHPVDGDAPLRILISSGTSGDPKGMVLSHAMMALRNQSTETGATSSSRVLPMDMNFIIGFRPAMSALARGSALVFPPSLSPAHVLQGLVGHHATHVYFSPVQAREAAALAGSGGPVCRDMVCLRLVGGPASPDLLRTVSARLSPNVFVTYGSTEAGMVTYATPEILARQPGTVGPVCEWAAVEVVDAEDSVLPTGLTGRLRIRSEHQVTGYLHDDERNRRHFRGGWFYPGDLGRFDADGLLYIEGRVDEQLNIGGMKINPEDIEATLATHPEVADVGAFVMNESEGSEMLAVALVLSDASQLDAVRAHARMKLGPLAPARYLIVPALPRTTTGKLKRGELAALLSANSR
jgi:acyl-CoA synthetase (AMP-forming)/AMP-acid ligase II